MTTCISSSRVISEQDNNNITTTNNNTTTPSSSFSSTVNVIATVISTSVPIDDADFSSSIIQQEHQQQKKFMVAMSKSCDNSPIPAMSASRRKSFKDNMESLVRRLENELADNGRTMTTDSVALSSTYRTLSRANGTQTMPVGGLARSDGRDIAPFTFRRVYVVDELSQYQQNQYHQLDYHQQQHQLRSRVPSTSSTPNSSSAENSSVSDCSSEFSIDSSSDRSSIISLEDSLDHHLSSSSTSSSSSSSWSRTTTSKVNLLQQTHRLRKISASCFNVWDSSSSSSVCKRKWPKECSGAVARAMSQFANGCSSSDCRPAARLRVFDDKTTDACITRDKRYVGLELMRERNGNVVVIREIKTNSGNRYTRCNELKCETVQSRIRKLQVQNCNSVGGIQIEKSSNIF